MRTHNVLYFKQRINKDLFEEDVRRINCKVYFSISLELIRKRKLWPFTLFLPCNMHVIHSKGGGGRSVLTKRFLLCNIYILQSEYIYIFLLLHKKP